MQRNEEKEACTHKRKKTLSSHATTEMQNSPKMQSEMHEITEHTSEQTTLIMINMPNKWTLTICLFPRVRSEIHLASLFFVSFISRAFFLRIIAGLEFHRALSTECVNFGVTCFFLTWCYSLPQKSFSSHSFLHAFIPSSFWTINMHMHTHRTIKLTLTSSFLRLSSNHYTRWLDDAFMWVLSFSLFHRRCTLVHVNVYANTGNSARAMSIQEKVECQSCFHSSLEKLTNFPASVSIQINSFVVAMRVFSFRQAKYAAASNSHTRNTVSDMLLRYLFVSFSDFSDWLRERIRMILDWNENTTARPMERKISATTTACIIKTKSSNELLLYSWKMFEMSTGSETLSTESTKKRSTISMNELKHERNGAKAMNWRKKHTLNAWRWRRNNGHNATTSER